MGNIKLCFVYVCCLWSVVCSLDGNIKLIDDQKQVNGWCIAVLTADPDKMQGFIDYACTVISCAPILPGGACFDPDLIPAHANYCLNFIYKTTGNCNSEIAHIITLDPSYGTCTYI